MAHSGTDNGVLRSLRTLFTGYNSKPHGLTVADFDNDGQLDIAVVNNGITNTGVFFSD